MDERKVDPGDRTDDFSNARRRAPHAAIKTEYLDVQLKVYAAAPRKHNAVAYANDSYATCF
jgi:hypothetical protein